MKEAPIDKTLILLISYEITIESIELCLAANDKYRILIIDLQILPLVRLKKNPRKEVPFNAKYHLFRPESYLSCLKLLRHYKNSIYIKYYQDDIYDFLIRLLVIGKTVVTFNTFSSFLLLKNRKKKLNLTIFIDKLVYYSIRLIDIYFTKNILFTNRAIKSIGYLKTIRLNNDIYDEYIDYIESKNLKISTQAKLFRAAIILGNNIFEDYDYVKTNEKFLDFNRLFKELNQIISILGGRERVTIFLHPKTDINKALNLLGNYQFQSRANFQEIDGHSIVLGYGSTALIYPLLLKIPVGIITSDDLKKSDWISELINWNKKIFGVSDINISQKPLLSEIKNKSVINNIARAEYINQHLCSNPILRNKVIFLRMLDEYFQ